MSRGLNRTQRLVGVDVFLLGSLGSAFVRDVVLDFFRVLGSNPTQKEPDRRAVLNKDVDFTLEDVRDTPSIVFSSSLNINNS